MLLNLLMICCGCAGAPEIPVDQKVDGDWVKAAIEWRLNTGTDRCGEVGKAVDALSLEWIAQSTEVVIRLDTDEWQFLRVYEEFKFPMIQLLAFAHLNETPMDQEEIRKKMRKVIRRTKSVPYRRVRPYLRASEGDGSH